MTVTGSDAKAALADLVARADVIHFHDADFRRELAAWLSPNGSERGDGMPGYALGFGDFASRLAPFVARTLDLGRSQAAKSHELACSRHRCSPSSPLTVTATGSERVVRSSASCSRRAQLSLRRHFSTSPSRSPSCARRSTESSS